MPIELTSELLCKEIDVAVDLDALAIPFIGGMSFTASLPSVDIPDASAAVKAVLGQIGVALAPIQPLFIILDALTAVAKLSMAVPDALGPPPDPSKLIDAVADVVVKVGKLALIVPQLSIPITIKKVLLNINTLLIAVKVELHSLIDVLAELDATEARALELELEFPEIAANLRASIGCATEQADMQVGGLGTGLKPLKFLFQSINMLLDTAEIPKEDGTRLPDLEDLGGGGAAAIQPFLDALDVITQAVGTVLAVIPI